MAPQLSRASGRAGVLSCGGGDIGVYLWPIGCGKTNYLLMQFLRKAFENM